jgi:hypothetical protein
LEREEFICEEVRWFDNARRGKKVERYIEVNKNILRKRCDLNGVLSKSSSKRRKERKKNNMYEAGNEPDAMCVYIMTGRPLYLNTRILVTESIMHGLSRFPGGST